MSRKEINHVIIKIITELLIGSVLIFMHLQSWNFSTLFLSTELSPDFDQLQLRVSNYKVILSARLISMEIKRVFNSLLSAFCAFSD